MEALDKISGIIGYAVIRAEDGLIVETRGSSTQPIGDLTAFFSSAAEVIKNRLALGVLDAVSLCYGANRLVIFLYESHYIGVEVPRENSPRDIVTKIKASITREEKRTIELPRSISSKLHQINLLVAEFGGEDNMPRWLEFLNQGLSVLGGDILPSIGVINGELAFKAQPVPDKEDDYVQGLRSIIDFLVKKAVIEMGSAQARIKVQAVIEKMR